MFDYVYFLIPDSDTPGNVLLVRELRNLLSDLQSPFSMLTSEVLVPSVLDKVTGEKLLWLFFLLQQKTQVPLEFVYFLSSSLK